MPVCVYAICCKKPQQVSIEGSLCSSIFSENKYIRCVFSLSYFNLKDSLGLTNMRRLTDSL